MSSFRLLIESRIRANFSTRPIGICPARKVRVKELKFCACRAPEEGQMKTFASRVTNRGDNATIKYSYHPWKAVELAMDMNIELHGSLQLIRLLAFCRRQITSGK